MDLDLTIPSHLEPFVRLGTCSWKYDSWVGLLYPEGRPVHKDEYLSIYGEHLGTVEVDQWFWSLFPRGLKLPDPTLAARYAASVPEDFVFTVKMPNAITLTNFYARQPKGSADWANRPNDRFLSVELTEQVLSRLEPMGDKLGPLLFQFEYLNRKKMASVDTFVEALDQFFGKLPEGFRYAVEVRNKGYLVPSYFDMLRRHDVGHVLLEGYYMPPLAQVVEAHDVATSDVVVVRLHGGDREAIEELTGSRWDRVVEPHLETLTTTAALVEDLAGRGIRTIVNVNNHLEGSAPLTIERLLSLLRGFTPDRLDEPAEKRGAGQGSLEL